MSSTMKFKKTPFNKLTQFTIFLAASSILLMLVINSNALAATNYGNALPSDLLLNKTATTDTGGIVGTMPNKVGSATVITPGTTDQVIPQGYYGGVLADGKVKGDANLVAANIVSGKSIFGVAGNVSPDPLTTFVHPTMADVICIANLDTMVGTANTTFTKVREIRVNRGGTIGINFELSAAGADGMHAYGRVYVNGIAVGSEFNTHDWINWPKFHDLITVNANDLVQLYLRSDLPAHSAAVRNISVWIGNTNPYATINM